MVKIGMMIGDRYEILEKIGTGGMSDVYKAKCHKLNRYVAVKVLKQEFAENENFVSKFNIEAQAAAGLMHPNIVNVYDVGEENGIHYIVMELIEGITLKKYIEKKARLSYKEAVSIAIQVSMGIEAAHNHHIIHRDIKPQNIIISKDGKVKVTDFGIAKAATSNTITSNVMGSVHYTSPEQARGGYSDEKSDIYSLGITLFEMLTGRVPFNGETTVAIAIRHIQEELPSPREFVAEIPVAVESIVLKCCQKSPDRRYQNMQELITDLKHSLVNPDDDFVVMTDPDLEGGTRAVPEGELAQLRRRSIETSDTERMRLLRDDPAFLEQREGEEEGYDESDSFRMEKITTILIAVVGVAIIIVIVILGLKLFHKLGDLGGGDTTSPIIDEQQTPGPDETMQPAEKVYKEMPTVEGLQVEDARRLLMTTGLYASLEYVESDTVPEGQVISADIPAGNMIEEGSVVTLTVSSGISGTIVPEVTGYTFEDASNRLTQMGFLVYKLEEYNDTIDAGLVFYQNPVSGVKAPRGSTITVTVSKGKENIKCRVPNLVGLQEEDALLEIIESGLQVGNTTRVYNASVSQGLVCYQSYSHGTYVDEGTAIDISVSLGAEKYSYKCNASITAPNADEAPDYSAGSEVRLRLVTDTGQELLNTKTSSFPYSANYYNLDAPGGILTVTYTVVVPGEATVDPETGETVIGPSTTKEKFFTRRIDFVRE